MVSECIAFVELNEGYAAICKHRGHGPIGHDYTPPNAYQHPLRSTTRSRTPDSNLDSDRRQPRAFVLVIMCKCVFTKARPARQLHSTNSDKVGTLSSESLPEDKYEVRMTFRIGLSKQLSVTVRRMLMQALGDQSAQRKEGE